jgi:hypothetical protein
MSLLLFGCLTLIPAAPDGDPARVEKILQTHCHRCHGQDGTSEGGFGYALNRERLVATKKIVPGDPGKSAIIARMSNPADPMPPEGESPRPSAEDIAEVKKWIERGAPAFGKATAARKFISPVSMIEAMARDVEAANPRDRAFRRYFTLTHLYNAGISDDELQSYRVGLSKLVNSLSWGKTIIVPRAVDAEKTIYGIDLRDYQWTSRIWDEVLFENPFGLDYKTDTEKKLRESTQTRLPYVRADWFVHTAARPPLYHEILQLPKTDLALEQQLRVDVAENIRQDRVTRAGFNGSGVSRNNRLIERHESPYGAYWKSYDFAGNARDKNLFASPLGPGAGPHEFRHDGGEIIFNLPNGLQAYLLVDGEGRRIDKGPVEIVSDPKRPDRQVINGLSCMSCHARGMIEKDDQVRAHLKANSGGFPADVRNKALALYREKGAFTRLIRSDAERFRKAVQATGAPLSATEPVAALARRFEDELDLNMIAAEVGVTPDDFIASLAKSAKLTRVLGGVRSAGGTVQRDVVNDDVFQNLTAFGDIRVLSRSRRQVPGEVPQSVGEKTAEDHGAMTFSFPDDSPAKGKRVNIRRFRDVARKQWIFVSEKGHMATLPDDRPKGPATNLTNVYFSLFDLPGPPNAKTPPGKVTVALFFDPVTEGLIYLSDLGGITAFRAARPSGKLSGFTTVGNFTLPFRDAGQELFGETVRIRRVLAVQYAEPNVVLLIGNNGGLAVTTVRPGITRPRVPHGYSLPVRNSDQGLFGTDVKSHALEVYELPGTKLALLLNGSGSLAVIPSAVSDQSTVPPVAVDRLRLKVTGPPTVPTSQADRSRSGEYYRDPNTRETILITETGHFTVVQRLRGGA